VNILRCAVVAVAIIASSALSQEVPTGTRYEIRGMVFDSVAGVPLAGAMVQVAARGADGAPYTGFTDSLGLFSFSQLPAGTFIVGFYHENLSALGLDAPLVSVELGAASVVTANLAIPSAPVVRALRCGNDSLTNAAGMLVGFLRAAEGGLALPGATLRLSWRALALEASKYRTVTAHATAVISSDGSFLVCDLPVDAALDLEVTAPGRRTLSGAAVVIPADAVARLDVALVDTARTSGSSRIHGRVRTTSGKIVTTGRAIIASLGRDVPIRDGEFQMNDMPSGSWLLEARVIGSEPTTMLVDARDSSSNVVEMRVGKAMQRLDVVTVVGRLDTNARVLQEVLRRRRLGMGTVFLPGSPALTAAIWTSDVMREARGFTYESPTRILARVNLTTSGPRRCANIAVYVDGMLQPYGFDGLQSVAPPSEVLAIETFPDILLAPVEYRSAKVVMGTPLRSTAGSSHVDTYCAVVLVWTKK